MLPTDGMKSGMKSQMSTPLPGVQSFFRFFASFSIGEIRHQQHKGYI